MKNTTKIILVALLLVVGAMVAIWLGLNRLPLSRPVLNKQTASIILSNGTQETRVYELLGTNAAVSTGQNGEKSLHYFFMFTGAPAKVTSELSAITITLSNGVVIGRTFPEGR